MTTHAHRYREHLDRVQAAPKVVVMIFVDETVRLKRSICIQLEEMIPKRVLSLEFYLTTSSLVVFFHGNFSFPKEKAREFIDIYRCT